MTQPGGRTLLQRAAPVMKPVLNPVRPTVRWALGARAAERADAGGGATR